MIQGDTETIRRLLSLKSEVFRRVQQAVEKTALRMANSARAGHEHGSDPHARGRYENQTANLTGSLFPGGSNSEPMKWEKLTEDEIVGLFGVNAAAPGAVMEYAEKVEEDYPFIWPAAAENIERFKEEIAACAPK